MDTQTLTNNDFKKFVDDTGYITEAERYGWSFVFYQFVSRPIKSKVKRMLQQTPWWLVIQGAS